jgi:glycosyltransferase involved in cell wall biosynthesis
VIVLENGVDLERFHAIPPADFLQPHVGVVGNLRHVKGLDLLIDAAQHLLPRYPNLRIEVAGEGGERAALQARIDAAGLRHCFTLCGSIADIPAFLGRHPIAVSCSRAEGMSNAILEYMAAGRAIVATAVGANPRLIENGIHGLLCPSEDVEALSRALSRLFDSPALVRQLARAGRQRVEREFSRPAMVRRFEQCYQQLVRRTRAA